MNYADIKSDQINRTRTAKCRNLVRKKSETHLRVMRI